MAADLPAPPTLVSAFQGHYELLREAGRGGSGTVYVARDLKHGRLVAIKVLDAEVGNVSADRFLLEIRLSAGMQHPHILPTYDSGVADGRLYFVMPFVDGGTLRDRLDKTPVLPPAAALAIARDIAIALAHAHELGVVHRDVKPENILFYHGVACLADFGIAKVIEELNPLLTAQGTFVGTPAYMSPEQYAAVGFDGRTDIYSLSCVLYEMVAGTRLFTGKSPNAILAERGVPRVPSPRPDWPASLQSLLAKGLAADPDKRIPTARAFVEAANEAIRDIERSVVAASWRRIAAAVGVTALVALGAMAWGNKRESATEVLQQGATVPEAMAAIKAWNVSEAVAALEASDTTAPTTRLWLLQSHALAGRHNREDFRIAALRLRGLLPALHGRDSMLATALIAFASDAPSSACSEYRRLLARDSLDEVAWFGLGDCQRVDSSVVADASSPSGWRFSSSYGAAASAYLRATTLNPNAHAAVPFAHLTRLLPSSASSIRIGRARGTAGGLFAAYPALIADTLAFVPYPIAQFTSIGRATISPTQPDALERNREMLLEFAGHWTTAMPRSADAWDALAFVRESRGELSDDSTGAIAALRRARRLATDSLRQAQLAATHVRLLLKRGEFAGARSIADSLILAWQAKDAPQRTAEVLAGLSALTGRVDLMARYSRIGAGSRLTAIGASPELAGAAARFTSRAAPGVCDDSLRLLRSDFERILDSYSTPSRRDQIRQATIWQGAALAFPCLGEASVRGLGANSPLDRAQRAFAARDPRRVRALLDSLAGLRVGYKPGDISLDHTVQEAWLRASIGDSAAAERQLDLVLDALPTLGMQSVLEPAQSAAVGRAMVLRVEIAVARGDRPRARRWASAVSELWKHADPALTAAVARMRGIAGP